MEMCWIGFGEAATTFARGLAHPGRAFDLRDDNPMVAAMEAAGVRRCSSHAEAASGAALVLSLVTADQALAAAQSVAQASLGGALYFDMNSVAPDTKRAAARTIQAAGGRYVDVAVMAPVQPKARGVPLLVAGPHAAEGASALAKIGFSSVDIAGESVGDASAVKMIRSVVVKGMEALSAECALAADAAGVLDQVVASLDASWQAQNWAGRFDYNLDRMMVHGTRRAAEMDEVVKTLDALGSGSVMSRATAERQRRIGALELAPENGLAAKLQQMRAAA
ncbi:NAD(P)-dependent oxidoreductase [Sphingomonas piscis]|uniref:NAD(P)-dependent oxidoreductase n=1 Tax=Sphingomonas piscis TaxID=2714943 RepID=A0A6G7YM15_9SPHN|nr:NAD(P)-dependent oxidoreductase [Sphingomonas piscis]QIK77790.1 NAD(P)-dependent oxidoreductase [Sphingomonas piscis]